MKFSKYLLVIFGALYAGFMIHSCKKVDEKVVVEVVETCNTMAHNEPEAFEVVPDSLLPDLPDTTIRIGLVVHIVGWDESPVDTTWAYKIDSILAETNKLFQGYIALERYEYIWEYDIKNPTYLNDIRNDYTLERFLVDSKFDANYLNWFILPARDNLGGYAPMPNDTLAYQVEDGYDCVFTSDSYFKRRYVYSLAHEAAHNLGRLPHFHEPPRFAQGIDTNIMDYGPIKDYFTKGQLAQMVLNIIRYRDNLIL